MDFDPHSIQNIQIHIPNFQQLREFEIVQIMDDLVHEYMNLDIIGIQHIHNNYVEVQFRILSSENNQNEIHQYEEEIDNQEDLHVDEERIVRLASQLKFPNCKTILQNLGKAKQIKKNDPLFDQSCFICFENYQEKELVRNLPDCNHSFHKKCIDKWLKRKAQCPVCRNNVLEKKVRKYFQDELNP